MSQVQAAKLFAASLSLLPRRGPAALRLDGLRRGTASASFSARHFARLRRLGPLLKLAAWTLRLRRTLLDGRGLALRRTLPLGP